ncbi:unnamed protein product [Leptosia nina]|uniref:Uncharacterized protein n=1 Tax=Leptosia nina TaxID=320188 RepID=A0AAV1J2M7_9NEOP
MLFLSSSDTFVEQLRWHFPPHGGPIFLAECVGLFEAEDDELLELEDDELLDLEDEDESDDDVDADLSLKFGSLTLSSESKSS